MRRSTDRILTTHVGSLVRPPELLQAGSDASTSTDARELYLTVLAQVSKKCVGRRTLEQHVDADVMVRVCRLEVQEIGQQNPADQ